MLFRLAWAGFVALAAICIVVPAARACNVPVFRYALERWQPDPLEVIVLSRGPLTDAQLPLVATIQRAADDPRAPANVTVRTVDLDQPVDEETQAILDADGAPEVLPWMLVRYGMSSGRRLAYSGPLDEPSVTALLDSPARREIVRRIVSGDSAVWVLIESGDREKDDAAEKTLREELARLEGQLQLPDQSLTGGPDDLLAPSAEIELRLGFSLLRVGRGDLDERVFVWMLINSEPDLHEFQEPIAVPLFGRGRSYFALVGRGITPQNVEDLCTFVVGACSCQVKAENPGADMLFAANWDELITGSAIRERELPALTGLGGLDAGGESEAPADKPTPENETHGALPQPEPAKPAAAAAVAGKVVELESNYIEIPLYVPVIGVVLLGVVAVAIGTYMMRSRDDSAR